MITVYLDDELESSEEEEGNDWNVKGSDHGSNESF